MPARLSLFPRIPPATPPPPPLSIPDTTSSQSTRDPTPTPLRLRSRVHPSPDPTTPPPPAPSSPAPWLWRCHSCLIVYRLGCTRRCLECSHTYCTSADLAGAGSGLGELGLPRRRTRLARRRAGGPCRSEFDYAAWAGRGDWRRHVLLELGYAAVGRDGVGRVDEERRRPLEGLRAGVWLYQAGPAAGAGESHPDPSADGAASLLGEEARERMRATKEALFLDKRHDCWVHCDYPSQCRHELYSAVREGRVPVERWSNPRRRIVDDAAEADDGSDEDGMDTAEPEDESGSGSDESADPPSPRQRSRGITGPTPLHIPAEDSTSYDPASPSPLTPSKALHSNPWTSPFDTAPHEHSPLAPPTPPGPPPPRRASAPAALLRAAAAAVPSVPVSNTSLPSPSATAPTPGHAPNDNDDDDDDEPDLDLDVYDSVDGLSSARGGAGAEARSRRKIGRLTGLDAFLSPAGDSASSSSFSSFSHSDAIPSPAGPQPPTPSPLARRPTARSRRAKLARLVGADIDIALPDPDPAGRGERRRHSSSSSSSGWPLPLLTTPARQPTPEERRDKLARLVGADIDIALPRSATAGDGGGEGGRRRRRRSGGAGGQLASIAAWRASREEEERDGSVRGGVGSLATAVGGDGGVGDDDGSGPSHDKMEVDEMEHRPRPTPRDTWCGNIEEMEQDLAEALRFRNAFLTKQA